ncbi:hypothetical protein CHGG_05626 [Chaetomium globosum CBS 148.51]|uniref:Uncharacterized protein n=1 Tax=Chaetomium globosum (strain ATCC 6205 / CBS 148.51 / DSM 1962 / NBRC 6347 / NRRL 1970) TaxID=306901 RepID=Q2H6T9_CHAGB|nr:uncharacterized protein CHGG_05626 [Chaetomium globosum CBS 148.51]EAQ89007.1 hypothetical protein CHGG_05626 [Chaetomium globosum CBS 148.51]
MCRKPHLSTHPTEGLQGGRASLTHRPVCPSNLNPQGYRQCNGPLQKGEEYGQWQNGAPTIAVRVALRIRPRLDRMCVRRADPADGRA